MAVVLSEGVLTSTASAPTPSSPVGSLTYLSGFTEDYAAIYRTQPNVRLVVSFLARNIAQLNLAALQDDGNPETASRRPLERGHPLSQLLRRPNPWTTRHRFVDALVRDLKIFDHFYAIKLRNTVNGKLSLFRIPPRYVQPIGNTWARPDGFRIQANGVILERDASEFLYLHGYDPDDNRIGCSPMEALRQILVEGEAAARWREQLWKSGARISGVIERPLEAPKWGDTAARRFKEDFRAAYGLTGDMAGLAPVLEEGMTWKEASFSAKDSEYLAARRLSREEVAAQYHVSPLFVGILDNANFSNVQEQHKHLYQDTLGPDLDMIQQDYELQVVEEEFADLENVDVEFDLLDKLRGSFAEEARILQTAVGAPWLQRNEARNRQGLPPVDGGDELITPMNVTVGGQASPTDTAPPLDTAPPGQAARRARAALPRPGAGKARAPELTDEAQAWADLHLLELASYFTRQGATIQSRIGAGQDLADAWDTGRWDGELSVLLAGVAGQLVEAMGTATAAGLGAGFDPAEAEAWVAENARIAAEEINATTHGQIADTSMMERAARVAAVASIFQIASTTRADEIAVSRTTSVGNFARHEGARQGGAVRKIWRAPSTSPTSRHQNLDGDAVDLDGVFSNGARWPGDPALPLDQRAGCVCYLDFERQEAAEP